MNNKIMEGWFKDLQKPEIDKYERATILKDFMKENKLSIRAFAKEYGFKNSTIQDWLLWDKLDPEKIEELKDNGLNETDIYRTLRDNKNKDVEKLFIEKSNKFEIDLWKIYKKLTEYNLISKIEHGENVKKLIHDIKLTIEEIENRL